MNLVAAYELMQAERKRIEAEEKLEQEKIEAHREEIIEDFFEIFSCEQNRKPVQSIILTLKEEERKAYGYHWDDDWIHIGANLYDNWQDLANYMQFVPDSTKVKILLHEFSKMDELERTFVLETLEKSTDYFVVKDHPCVPGKVILLKE